MNRTEYMRELDALLHGISKEEREEAMQYYNDIILMTPEARMKKK